MTDTNGPRLPEDALSAYVDGELSPAEHAAVEARLARDELWRHIFDDVVIARDTLRGLPEREPPAGFWLRVLTNVAEIAEHDQLTGAPSAAVVPLTRSLPRRIPRWGAIAGAAAAVVVGVAIASPQHHTRVTPNVATFVDSHAATQSLQSNPLDNLAPAAVPVNFNH
jgi:negative regulator of sigma E activity